MDAIAFSTGLKDLAAISISRILMMAFNLGQRSGRNGPRRWPCALQIGPASFPRRTRSSVCAPKSSRSCPHANDPRHRSAHSTRWHFATIPMPASGERPADSVAA